MGIAKTYVVNTKYKHKTLLIATQGSKFKDKVVKEIVDHFKEKKVYIKVIDVTKLPSIDEEDWDAIAILHVWEIWKPQPDAEKFINQVKDPSRLVVFVTSGDGIYKMENVDAITGASILSEASSKALQIEKRINAILNL